MLVERNSHFHYLFTLPRFSVLKTHEWKAFIPYTHIGDGSPEGILQLIQGEVETLGENHAILKSGDKIPFEYAIISTGTSSALPNHVSSTERADGIVEVQGIQSQIEKAENIAIVGGGEVESRSMIWW